MKFHDVTISATGDRFSSRVYDTTALNAGAVEVFRSMLDCHGWTFREPVPLDRLPEPLTLQLTTDPAGDTGMATFWARGVPLFSSALVVGDNDRGGLTALAQMGASLLRKMAGPQVEPSFDLLSIKERPLHATLVIIGPDHLSGKPWPIRSIAVDASTCLAAAWFLAQEEEG